jgi:cell division transport system ATP-binding protein
MILFNGVYKIYPGNITGLENINLKIEDGEFIFLVGSSGAGKSTLLKLLIKEILPSSGSVFIDEWEINKLPSSLIPKLRRKAGFVFQDFKLLSDRTVTENIAVTLEILGKREREMSDRINQILEIVHLSDKGNFFPKQLSFGEQQRVAIGRAIAGEAKILLADEPTGNLDPKTSWEILKIISEINKLGTTVLMATHNVDIVNSMKKRVLEIKDGKIIRDAKNSKYS